MNTEKNTDKEPLEVKIINILTSKKFCRKKPDKEESNKLETTIKLFIGENKPLRLVVLFGGYKNPHTGLTDPDLAETKTLQRLNILLGKLRMVYPGGAELYVVTTGKKGEIANGISPQKTSVYEKKISNIAKNFRGINIIPIGSLYSKFFNNGRLEEMISEERNKQSQFLEDENYLAEKIKIAEKHNSLPLNGDEESRKKAVESAIIYSILSSKEPEILDSEFGSFIKLSFRIKGEEGALPFFTCRKKMIHQPWNNACVNCMHLNRCFAESKNGKIIYC